MRHSISMILLSAGVVLSLVGCQKDPNGRFSGKAVRFSASSASAETRTAFSGDGTQDGDKKDEFGRKILTWERIDWKVGDKVMIASDNAKVLNSTKKNATYTVETVTPNGNISDARVEEMAGDQELFFTGADSYTFWGIYPASAGDGTTLESGKANFAFSDPAKSSVENTITKNGKTLTVIKSDMTKAVMLAAEENVKTETVDLKFYPAFTAFEFTLASRDDAELPIKTLVLSSSENSPLTGSVVATIKSGEEGGKGKSEYTITSSSGGKLTYTFPDNTVVSSTKYVTFTVFVLPHQINGLTMEFHMGADGSNVQKGTLKYNGNDINFAGCKKHCLRGIAVKTGWEFQVLNLKGVPDEWTEVDLEIDNADQPEATQFEVSGANNGRYYTNATQTTPVVGRDSRADRQKWLMKNDATVTVKFKIMSPNGWNWLVVPEGDVDAYTITTNMAGNALTGPVTNTKTVDGQTIATTTNVFLYIKAKSTTDPDAHSLHFKTYVVDPDTGTKYSLDSETQLLEVRGYHEFLLNTTLN